MIKKRTALVLSLALALSACGGGDGNNLATTGGTGGTGTGGTGGTGTGGGGGGGGGSGGSGSGGGSGGGGGTPTPEQGVFIDSAVAGIHYQTATQSGETDAEGRFNYLPGETVTFSIGGIQLPPVAASDTVTPLMVFETNDFTDQRVVNLGRLLQSLDDDGDLDNGIQITPEARTAATGMTVDFNVAAASFEANTDVINLLSSGGGSATLVSEESAVEHMQGTLAESGLSLVGTWVWSEDGELINLILRADGTYVITEDAPADGGGEPGVEYGTYSWDPVSGVLTGEPLVDTNGEWGLSDMANETLSIVRDGDTFVLTVTADGEVDTTTWTRVVPDANNPIVGTWSVDGMEDGKLAFLVFAADGSFIQADVAEEGDEAGEPGIERGTYEWNAQTFAFSAEIVTNTNGDWGISDQPILLIQVDGDTMTATMEGDEVVTLTRIH